jgi:hypothetical protein
MRMCGPGVSTRPSERWSPTYHEARLGEHVADAVDRFRAGEQTAFDVDEVLHQYQRAARELRRFCWLAGAGAGVERTARLLRDMAAQDEPSTGGSSASRAIETLSGRPARLDLR